MVPDSVLHKRNGHRKPPRSGNISAGELVSLVHSAPGRLSDLSQDLLKFAVIAQSECATGTGEQLSGEDSTSFPAVAKALTQSREAFARGELSDIRASLEALRAQAALASDVIARLTNVIRTSDSMPYGPSGRRLLNVNELVVQALDVLTGPAPKITAVSTLLDPEIPSVAGDSGQIREVLRIVLLALAQGGGAPGRPGSIRVETSHRDGVLRGEKIVQIAMAPGGGTDGDCRVEAPVGWAPAGATIDVELERAGRIVREHGGILSAADLESGGTRFTLELPAV